MLGSYDYKETSGTNENDQTQTVSDKVAADGGT
jgi:hypothetical protein